MELEEWMPIEEHPGYEVSNYGRIKNKKGTCLGLSTTKTGYKTVSLHKNGFSKSYCVHRLVAQAFIPNPLNKPTVDHKDRNKSNNYVGNLRWATRQEQACNQAKKNTGYEFSSIYRGVSWASKNEKFIARLEANGVMLLREFFNTELEAGRAYHKKSKELYGEFYDGQPQYPELDEE